MKEDLRIMIIDDEKPIVDTLMMYFDRIGYNVTGFYNSVEAMNQLKQGSYDIVFTDLKMPEVSGMDIVRTVKEQETDTIVIIFTGYATTDSAIEAIQYGVYDYIRKPFKLDEIRVVLDRAVENLVLKRDNIALQKKIESMLGQVTMLADITDILYQVNDFDEVSSMILDTITEGLDISKVAVIGQKNDGIFGILHSRNIPDDLIASFSFRIDAVLNGQELGSGEPVRLNEVFEKGLVLDNRNIWSGDAINEMIFLPIRYMEKIQGYILICDPDYSFFNTEDTVRLFKILSTHIAPILRSDAFEQTGSRGVYAFEKLVADILNAEIDLAAKNSRSVTFTLFRLKNLTAVPEDIKILDVSKSFRNIIDREFQKRYDVMQLNFDTVLVVMPGANPLDIEFKGASIQQELETTFLTADGQALFSANYAIYTQVKKKLSAAEIISELNRLVVNQEIDLPESP